MFRISRPDEGDEDTFGVSQESVSKLRLSYGIESGDKLNHADVPLRGADAKQEGLPVILALNEITSVNNVLSSIIEAAFNLGAATAAKELAEKKKRNK